MLPALAQPTMRMFLNKTGTTCQKSLSWLHRPVQKSEYNTSNLRWTCIVDSNTSSQAGFYMIDLQKSLSKYHLLNMPAWPRTAMSNTFLRERSPRWLADQICMLPSLKVMAEEKVLPPCQWRRSCWCQLLNVWHWQCLQYNHERWP